VQEVSANLLPLSAHGAMNDPGPASSGGHGLGMITDLQTVISVLGMIRASTIPSATLSARRSC